MASDNFLGLILFLNKSLKHQNGDPLFIHPPFLKWYMWADSIGAIYSYKKTKNKQGALCKTPRRNKMISETNYWGFHLEENSMIYLEVWGSHYTDYHICLAIFITRWYSSCTRESTCPVAESDHLRAKREGIKLFILQLEGRNPLCLLSAEVRVFCFTFLLYKALVWGGRANLL